MDNLEQFKGKTYSEAIAEIYDGQFVEIYLGENGGINHYAENSVEQKIYISGFIKEAIGNLLIFEAVTITNSQKITKEIALNGWEITAVMPKNDSDKIHINHFFQEIKR
jgi:hypothetical protein